MAHCYSGGLWIVSNVSINSGYSLTIAVKNADSQGPGRYRAFRKRGHGSANHQRKQFRAVDRRLHIYIIQVVVIKVILVNH